MTSKHADFIEIPIIILSTTAEFKKAVKERKLALGYIKQSNNSNFCENCQFFNSFSPHLYRCDLISDDVHQRCANVRRQGVCDMYAPLSEPWDSKNETGKYPSIKLELD